VQAASTRLHNEPCRLQMPVLDNMHAVQAGLQRVVNARANNRIIRNRGRRPGRCRLDAHNACASPFE
jgi:hypothetical protein